MDERWQEVVADILTRNIFLIEPACCRMFSQAFLLIPRLAVMATIAAPSTFSFQRIRGKIALNTSVIPGNFADNQARSA